MDQPWLASIPTEDRDRYLKGGFGGVPQKWTGERPALLVIDVTRSFVGDPSLTDLENLSRYRTYCGPTGSAALPVIVDVLRRFRRAGLPVFFTAGATDLTTEQLGGWNRVNSRAADDARTLAERHAVVDEVAPLAGEMLIRKEKPSAFHGTPLLGHLLRTEVDSLVVVGCSTSGCVRATVVDGFSYNLPVCVVADATFDRSGISHDVALFDMAGKYAQVVMNEELVHIGLLGASST